MPVTFKLGGLVDIQDPVIDGVFPLLPDYDVTRELDYPYIIHKFSLKKEQRILTRQPRSTWRLRHEFVTQTEIESFYTFYDAHRKPDQLFYFYDPTEANCPFDETGADEQGRYACRFKESELSFQAIRDLAYAGQLEIVEVNVSTTVQEIGSPLDFEITPSRYPRDTSGGGYVLDMWLKSELTGSMDLVPLVVIMPKEAGTDNYIHVSDRLCHIQQIGFSFTPTEMHGDYLPRLLSWDISQQIGEGDKATFVFDNADQVWDSYANQFDLGRAIISYNIQTGGPFWFGQWTLKLWRGYILDWNSNRNDGTFTVECEGGIHALNSKLPRRTASTTCPLVFNFGTQCPYDAVGSGGDPDECDKGLDTPNGCTAHGMTNYFQGVVVKPVTATGLLPRNAESVWSFGRKAYTTTSTPLKSIQDTVIPLVYGDGRQIVEGKIFEFRDESEFKVASAIVSDGPIGEIGMMLLDGLAHHFVPGQANPGIRALGEIGQNIGTIIDPDFRSSALSFVSTRTNDEIGIQSAAENHTMLVEVLRGLKCLHTTFWTGPLDSHFFVDTSNPIIIAHDLLARAVGASPYAFESIQNTRGFRLDMWRYLDAVNYCETVVDKLGETGTEKRFEFRGVIQEQKPAIEHIRDVAATAPVDVVYTYANIAFKVRRDDITNPPPGQITFEHGENIIQGSFHARRWEPAFNEIKLLFADQESDFQENSVTLYDEAAQKRIGFYDDLDWNVANASKRPLVKQRQINLTGCFSRSQAVRLGTQLLYEELGGQTEQEQLDARVVELEAPVLGLAVEIGDVSKVIHPDLPGGFAWVRWESFQFSNEWKVKLSGRTITVSMYAGQPLQVPSSNPGEVMDFPPLEALTPPVLTLTACNFSMMVASVSPKPAMVNYLVVQIDDDAGFAGAVDQVMAATTPSITVGGVTGVSQFIRAKWRRNAPVVGPPAIEAEESDWSNTVTCDFPPIEADDINSLPENACDPPGIPFIKAVYGWNEFLEVELGLGIVKEGVKALYAGPLTSGAWPKGGLYVQNLSSDPTIEIQQVDFLMGSNQAHAAGFTSLAGDHLDLEPYPVGRTTIPAATNIQTIDGADPGSPKVGWDYDVFFIGSAVPRWVHYVLIPLSVDDPTTLVCPQDSQDYSENVPIAYQCDGGNGASFFGARLMLYQFSAALRGVTNPTIEVAIYGRSAAAYSETLQRTFYDPFLPSSPWPGHYGSFYGNLAPSLPPARIKVKFSTGLVLDQACHDIVNQGCGILLEPFETDLSLDDFFVFVSESTFSQTLDAPSGDWWDMIATLPAGVHMARIARETNLFVSNLFGNKLETGKGYHVRVGARRTIKLCPLTYLWSATLSEEEIQQIQATSGGSSAGTATDTGPAPIVSSSDSQLQLIPGSGIRLVEDTAAGTLSVTLDTDIIRESSGYLFLVPGTPTVGTNVCAEITADLDGTFKDWALRAKTAPTGSSLIVDIHKNGTSIFANGSDRPTLTASSTSATGTIFDLPSFVKGDVFRMDIDQIGSSVAGERIQIQLNFDSPLRLL